MTSNGMPSSEGVLISTQQELRVKIDALNQQAWDYRFNDPARTEKLAREALALASSGVFQLFNYETGVAFSLLSLGRIKVDAAAYADAMQDLYKALELYDRLQDKIGLMRVYNEFGRVHFFLGDFGTALDYFIRENDLSQAVGDLETRVRSLVNSASVYFEINQPEQAREYLEKARAEGTTLNNPILTGQIIEGQASLALISGQLELATTLIDQALEMAQGENALALMLDTRKTQSDILVERGDVECALQCLQDGLNFAGSYNDVVARVFFLKGIAGLYLRKGQPQRAAKIFHEALPLAETAGAKKHLYEIHLGLAQAHKAIGDFAEALDHYEQFHALEKEVFNSNSDLRMKTLQVVHNVENARQEALIYQLRAARLQQEIEEQRVTQDLLEKLANCEPLTGLFNRRYFHDVGQHMLETAGAQHQSLAAVMVDVDHFKEVNDTYGHNTGDQVLIAISERIRANLRTHDLVCRYGGEEFAILLPDTIMEQAILISERLREALTESPLVPELPGAQVTISLGVATNDWEHTYDLDTLLDQADQALYHAKHAGRNRTHIFGLTPTP